MQTTQRLNPSLKHIQFMERQTIVLWAFIGITAFSLVLINIFVLAPMIWKPVPETKYMPIVLSYPDSMFRPFYGENASICTVKFLLEYQGTLAENISVKIINATCMSYVPYNISIFVGIPQAIKYELKETIRNNETMILEWGGTSVLVFSDSYTPVVDSPFEPVVNYHLIYPQLQETIYFPVAGDYSPIIMIGRENELEPIIYRYDQIRIHVASETEVESLNIDEVNLRFTLALFIFSWISYFALVYELVTKHFKKKDDCQIVFNINIPSDMGNTHPERKIEKTSNPQKSPNSNTDKIAPNEQIDNKKSNNDKTS